MKTETVLKQSCNAALIFLLTAVVCSAADVKQSAYPTKISPVVSDKALIIDSADGNKTKNVTLGSLPVAASVQTALDLKETKAVIQASAPADTTVDWYDTDQETGVLILKRHNGTTWVRVGSHGVQYLSSCAPITAGMCVDIDDGKLYYHNNTEVVEVGSGSVDLSAYLSKTNTTAFTPSGDYHPATKKYVDDSITAGGGYTDEQAQDAAGGMFSGNTETGITVTYDDTTGKVNFVVATQSDVNFTSALNTKLSGIATGAEVNANADWNSSSGDSQILNKPTIPTISDTAYGSGWNGDTGAASKNAIYDKIETIAGGSMTYPGAGIPVSTGSAWGTSITPGTGVALALAAAVDGTGGLASVASQRTLITGTGLSTATDTPSVGTDTISVTTNTYQAYDADWLGVTANGASLISAANYAAMKTLLDTDDIQTLTGIAAGTANLGTFTGTTIADSSTIKTGMQALETAVEGKPAIIASGAYTVDTASINANTCASAVAVTASGVATTDVIIATPSAILSSVTGFGVTTAGAVRVDVYPTSGNVNFQFCNPTGAAIDPGSVTFNWKVIR